MKQILCLSHEPWSTFPSRTQHLITRLKDTQILFFQPCGENRGEYREKGRRVRPGVVLYTLPPVMPYLQEHPRLYAMGRRRLARFVDRVAQRHRFRNPLLWTTCPDQFPMLDALSYGALLYDCDRDWSQYPIHWESELTLAADLVFAASAGLADHLSPCSGNLALIPNGGNHPMFSRDDLSRPLPMLDLEGPVLGWAGAVSADLDLAPLLYTARAHPDWNFLLLGAADPANPLLDRVRACPNVIVRQLDSLLELPDYLAWCDVCLNLLRERDNGLDIVPSRIYEYLSTGHPVVTMLWPDQVEHFPDVIYGAHSPESFCRLCEQALTEAPGWVSGRRRNYGRQAAWSHRAAEVDRILSTAGF